MKFIKLLQVYSCACGHYGIYKDELLPVNEILILQFGKSRGESFAYWARGTDKGNHKSIAFFEVR